MHIRIMHVVHSLGQGGLENGLVNLIEQLDSSRFEHTVVALRALGPNAERISPERAQIVRLAGGRPGSRIQVPELVRAIRQFQPHVVHSRNWAAIDAVFAGRWARSCALVHSEHGLESGAASEPWRRTCLRRIAFGMADKVLSVSEQLRDLHVRRVGFPAHKIIVIHNGVDHRRFSPVPALRACVRQELGLLEEDFCVGCVGNLLPVKDHLTLLKALDEVTETGGAFRLLLIGQGPELPKLQQFLSSRPRLSSQVQLLGSSKRVPEMLNAMDACVLCSLTEGISNSLLEAMATGVAVAATDVGGNPEVIIHGDSGLLFPVGDFRQLADILMLLRSNRDLRTKLGQQALRRVTQHFLLSTMVRKYEEVYQGVARVRSARLAAAHQ